MAVTAEKLATYVQTKLELDQAFISDCVAEGTALVAEYVGTREVPEAIKDRAVLEVAADLFYRRRSRNGVADFDDPTGVPVRINRDPMTAAYPILGQFMGPAIA